MDAHINKIHKNITVGTSTQSLVSFSSTQQDIDPNFLSIQTKAQNPGNQSQVESQVATSTIQLIISPSYGNNDEIKEETVLIVNSSQLSSPKQETRLLIGNTDEVKDESVLIVDSSQLSLPKQETRLLIGNTNELKDESVLIVDSNQLSSPTQETRIVIIPK